MATLKRTTMHEELRLRNYLMAALSLLLLSACTDSYDLKNMDNPRKLVVYAFPSTADTTFISVTSSVGVSKITDTREIKTIADADIEYRVNGQPREIQMLDDGTYFVVGSHQAGDHIDIRVSHEGYATVTATTTMPKQVPVKLERVVAVKEYEPDYYEARPLHKLLATFTDDAATDDDYAVRVCLKAYAGSGDIIYTGENGESYQWLVNDYEQLLSLKQAHPEATWTYQLTDSTTVWPGIVTNDEPLLNPLTSLDEDFGYNNSFYGNMYIFNDETINGQTYTLHLNVDAYAGNGYGFLKSYQVVLYRISHEYYQFLRSVNDIENNELAEGGFALLMPTYTNVTHGAGVVAAFNPAESGWMAFDENITQLK